MHLGQWRIWALTTRPRTLVASFSPVMLATCFAIAERVFHFYTFLCTILVALLIQILTNFANDYFDVKKGADLERIGPKRGLHHNLISLRAMKIAMILCIGLIVLFSSYLIYIGGALIFLLMLAAIMLALLYTAGPYSLAYTGLADFFVFIFFGPIACTMTYWLQTGSVTPVILLSSLSFGFLSTALLVVNNMRDYKNDKKVNKRTLVVRFGLEFGKFEYVAMLLGAILVPFFIWLFIPKYSVMLIVCFVMLTSIPMVIQLFKTDSPTEIGKLLLNTSFLLLSYTFITIFCIFYANR